MCVLYSLDGVRLSLAYVQRGGGRERERERERGEGGERERASYKATKCGHIYLKALP